MNTQYPVLCTDEQEDFFVSMFKLRISHKFKTMKNVSFSLNEAEDFLNIHLKSFSGATYDKIAYIGNLNDEKKVGQIINTINLASYE